MRVNVAVAVGLGLLLGCATGRGGQAGDVKGKTAAEYHPLAVGQRWTYQLDYLGQKQRLEVEVQREENGWFLDSQGSKRAIDAYGVRDEKRYLLREPVEVGTGWTNVVSVEAVEHYKILSVGVPCVVPAGRFDDCVVVESRLRAAKDATLVAEMTLARGVGMVRVATTLEREGKRVPQTSLELEAWTPAK